MQNKKFLYSSHLIAVLSITFVLVINVTYTDAGEKFQTILSSKQHESREIKSPTPIHFGFRLVGTIIAGEKNSYAVMLDETTGKQGMYKLGESINEATVIKICKESIIVEKDGRSYDLKITGGASPEILSGNMPPSTGVPKELPYFEPVFNQTGPAADEDVAAELPHFEPITNNTGPQVDDGGTHKELPEFEPIESDSGP